MTDRELFQDYYTEAEVAKLLGISVDTLRNRHYAKKNHPPRTPEKLYPKKEFHAWMSERLQWEHRIEKRKRQA